MGDGEQAREGDCVADGHAPFGPRVKVFIQFFGEGERVHHVPTVHPHFPTQVERERGGEDIEHDDEPDKPGDLAGVRRGDEEEGLEATQGGERVDEAGDGEGEDHDDVVVERDAVVFGAVRKVEFRNEIGGVGEDESPDDKTEDHEDAEDEYGVVAPLVCVDEPSEEQEPDGENCLEDEGEE